MDDKTRHVRGIPLDQLDAVEAWIRWPARGPDLGECFLTISLGEPYQDACYKLIAAIIPAT